MHKDLCAQDVAEWPDAAQLKLEGDIGKRYDSRRSAIIRYSQGLPATQAANECGISRPELYRMINRAVSCDMNGRMYGHRGLQKNLHLDKPRKNDIKKLSAKKPVAGAFTLLLKNFPDIRKIVDDLIISKKQVGLEAPLDHVSFATLFNAFRNACLDAELCAPSYPFNTAGEGRCALRRYRQALEAAGALGQQAQEAYLRAQLAKKGTDFYGAFMRSELDGYWMDVELEIEYEGREPGSVVRIPVKRIWIIAVIEQASTACLGYALSFGQNYPSSAVLSALRHCMLPWKPRTSNSKIRYAPGDGFPSMHEELAFMCFDELLMDNAKSQFNEMALATIERNYRAVPVFGPIASPRDRPQVEGCFSILERAGILDWKTIGRISADVLNHAVDALLAAYNNSRAPGSSRTRLETLRDMVAAGTTMSRRVPMAERAALERYDLVDSAKVARDGANPVVRWKGVRYYGEGLPRVKRGTPVVIRANSQDPREIHVTCEDTGEEIGLLLVERRWRAHPVELQVRQWLRKDPRMRHLLTQGSDITMALLAHIASKDEGGGAVQQRKKAVIAHGLSRSKGAANPSHAGGTPDRRTGSAPTYPTPQTPAAAPVPAPMSSPPLPVPCAVDANSPAADSSATPGRGVVTPRTGDMTHASQAFVSGLLKNLRSL